MSKSKKQCTNVSVPMATPMAESIRRFGLGAHEDNLEQKLTLIEMLAEAERRAFGLAMAGKGLLTFHDCGEIRQAIESLATDCLPEAQPERVTLEALLADVPGDDTELLDAVYSYADTHMRAAFCLGLAMGARSGGGVR